MSQISITISQATPCLCGLKQFSVSYDFKGWPGTPGQFFHGMFAGVTHEFCWGWNIQDGSCGGWASLFIRLVGLLSQWLSTPREQKLSSPLRARPEIDKAGGQSQVTRPAQIPGRRHSASVQGWEALLAAVFCPTVGKKFWNSSSRCQSL